MSGLVCQKTEKNNSTRARFSLAEDECIEITDNLTAYVTYEKCNANKCGDCELHACFSVCGCGGGSGWGMVCGKG